MLVRRLVAAFVSIFVGVPLSTLGVIQPVQAANSCPTGFSFVWSSTTVCERMLATSQTWTVPGGVTSISVVVIGGGGGGGGGGFAISTPWSGGGGGGGGVSVTAGLTVTPGATFAVTIGAGGAAGFDRGAGGTGGTSFFGSYSAGGGGGGGVLRWLANGMDSANYTTGGGGGGFPNGAKGGNGSSWGSNGYTTVSGLFVASPIVAGGGGGGGYEYQTQGGTGGGGASGTSWSPNCYLAVAGSSGLGGGGGGAAGCYYGSTGSSAANGGAGAVFIRAAAIVPATAPLAPTISAVTAGNGQLSLAFTAGSDGGSAITNYEYSINGGSSWTSRSPAAVTSPLVIPTLANGTSYPVQIRAVNTVGPGQATTSTSGTPLAPALTPTFGAVTRTSTGFTVNVTNFDSAYSWNPTVPAGAVAKGTATGTVLPLTVTGLSAGGSTTITVATVRSTFASGSGTVAGQALLSQTVAWAPATSVTTAQSALTPSSLATALGGAAITYSVTTFTVSACSVNAATGLLTFTGTGSCSVRANAAQTLTYASASRDVTFTVSMATQVITWSPATAVTTAQSPLTPSVSAAALGGAPLSYAVVGYSTEACSVDALSGVLTYVGAGSCAVRVSAAVTDTYAAASRDVAFTVSMATQVITWSPVTAVTSAQSPLTPSVSAVALGDAPLSYAVVGFSTDACAVDVVSGVLTYVGAGSCIVRVSAAATAVYPAAAKDVTFTVSMATQNLAWTPSTAVTTVQSPVTPTAATALGGAALAYAVIGFSTNACSVDAESALLTFSGAGSCTVRVTASATDIYAGASKDVTFSVSIAAQRVTWTPVVALTALQSPFLPTSAVTFGGVLVSYTKISNTTATCAVDVTTGELTFEGPGSCTVRASALATDTYAAGFTEVTFTVTRVTSSWSWSPATSFVVLDASTTLPAATTSSDATVTYVVTDPGTTGCALDGSRQLTFSGAGSCVITASLAMTDEYTSVSDIKTFAISQSSPNIQWSPNTALTLASLTAELTPASSSSDGAMTYVVTNAGSTGCAIASPASALITYRAPGTCIVTAVAATTVNYAMGTASATLSISKATPSLTWAPSSSLVMPGATVSVSSATTSSDAQLTYAVTSDAGAQCTISAGSGDLRYGAAGQCDVAVTVAETQRYTALSSSATFTVELAAQSISLTAVDAVLAPGGSTSLAVTGIVGSGTVTWSRNAAGTICNLSGTVVLGLADGLCVVTVAVAADAVFSGASAQVTIAVTTPVQSRPYTSGEIRITEASGASTWQSPLVPETSRQGETAPEELGFPGSSGSTRGRALPPPPISVQVGNVVGQVRSSVLIKQPAEADRNIRATVVVVRDQSSVVIARISIGVELGQVQIKVTIPFLASGYSVNAYNVNEVGVSRGARFGSSVVHSTTITSRAQSVIPTLFGAPMGRPVAFQGGSSQLNAAGKTYLKTLARAAMASEARLFITGFARMGGGSDAELTSLSTQRARVVAHYLSSVGVRVWIRYWGAGTMNGSGLTSERRVEIRSSALPVPRSLVP